MHNFGHVEIPTTNLEKAEKFYGSVFGWEFRRMSEIDYVFFNPGHNPNGGLELVKKMPRQGQVNVYVEVEDIDSKLKEIRKARGRIVQPKTQVGHMGYRAKFVSPDGCVICLWEPSPHDDATMSEPAIF
jgi:hypothetical protein